MSPATPEGCTLLLVDDEEANLDLLEDVLDRAGFTRLVRVADPREVVAAFERSAPDLVLLDLHMPHRSGFELLAELRARTPADEFLPVLVLTADATFDARRRALRDGANDFLTKPFQTDEVLLRVRNLLRTRLLMGEQRRARRAAELVAGAGRALGASLDGATAAEQVARLVVGFGAARCTVVLGEGAAPVTAADVRAAGVVGGAEDADALALPLRAAGREIGTMRVAGGIGAWSDGERDALGEVARLMALSIQNAQLYRAAHDAVQARERTLAVVAHELRGPLTAVRMDAEVLHARLRDEGGHPGEARRAERIDRAAARMDQLIEDLVEVSRIERGALHVRPERVDLRALAAEAAETLQPLAAAHGLAFDVAAPGAPCPAWADAARILQVISNLVGNAAKFTPAGGRVELGVADGRTEAEVWVRDTGPGLTPEELPHVFGSFWQARHADRRGLGLGLAIAQGIVDAHGGRIWVESAPGAGTLFRFTLPHPPPERA